MSLLSNANEPGIGLACALERIDEARPGRGNDERHDKSNSTNRAAGVHKAAQAQCKEYAPASEAGAPQWS